MLMRSINQYLGPNGERLEELVLRDTATGLVATEEQMKKELSEPEPITVFLGTLVVTVGIRGPDGNVVGNKAQQLQFPIPVATCQEAFEQYEKYRNEALEYIRKQQEEQKKQQEKEIVVPNAAQTEAINNLKLVRD